MAERLERNMWRNAGEGNGLNVRQPNAPAARESYHTVIPRRKCLDDWRRIYRAIF